MECVHSSKSFTQIIIRDIFVRYLLPNKNDPTPSKNRKIVTDSLSAENSRQQCRERTGHPLREDIERINSAFKCRISTYRFSPS